MKPATTIHFAHANGFPAPCYSKLFRALGDEYHVDYIDTLGHDDAYPVTENWKLLVKQLLHHLETHFCVPVIGVGHSLGGVLTFLAAVYRPDLFSAIILLDSPVYGRFKSHVIKALKLFGFMDKVSPAGRTQTRRQHWPTPEAAFEYLREKTVFADFDTDCLWDYVNYGMAHDEEGVCLRFERDIEYKIYQTFPHNLYRYRTRLKVPAALLYGEHSHVIQAGDAKNMARKLPMALHQVRGGHLFPFEYPEYTAEQIKHVIEQLCSQK